jgi:hypothetical protein
MQSFASTSFDAYRRLLAQPDPADLPRRAHVCRYEGDPNRRDARLPGIVTARRQRRNLELEVDASSLTSASIPLPTPGIVTTIDG